MGAAARGSIVGRTAHDCLRSMALTVETVKGVTHMAQHDDDFGPDSPIGAGALLALVAWIVVGGAVCALIAYLFY